MLDLEPRLNLLHLHGDAALLKKVQNTHGKNEIVCITKINKALLKGLVVFNVKHLQDALTWLSVFVVSKFDKTLEVVQGHVVSLKHFYNHVLIIVLKKKNWDKKAYSGKWW